MWDESLRMADDTYQYFQIGVHRGRPNYIV
jgi:hypothetical protein